ncbi:MAG: di-trans,poly-cis-decaprenylcistransferase [Flavobacteriia bacterium]|nr:MAG: di-trans,poly-cis-decaprenylcistransferase [Flavobacteriia bacterium]
MDKTLLSSSKKLPNHVAVIMDGNGRWAKQKGKVRIFGHKNGVESVRQTIEIAAEIGIKVLTLYAFSSENWNRPKTEVDALMNLLISSLKNELPQLQKNNIKLQAIGSLNKLPDKAIKGLEYVMEQTSSNDHMIVNLALSYGSRNEILDAVKQISKKVVNNELEIENIDEKTINNHLYTFSLPDVDLMIRTSGEQRISNFLLWQSAYAEFYFTETLWPDFRKKDFIKAIEVYQKRERRYGKTSEQISDDK